MSVNSSIIKETMITGLKEILNSGCVQESNKGTYINETNCDANYQEGLEADMVMSKNFTKSVKSFVENALLNDIDNHLKEIGNSNKETWKVNAHNLSKVLLDETKIQCVQDNLSNILDTCLKEVDHSSSKYFNSSELDISPLLQPEHLTEIAECMSVENPLDVRQNALRVLIKSHFSEAVNGEGWPKLQKKLVDCLCDNNIDIFVACIKVHCKLASCSFSIALKECTLNVLESLGRHYFLQHNECKPTLQNMHFYRMVYLTRLLLDLFREAALNIARFGESRLEEMIDSFIELMAIHTPSKQPKNKPILSPLDILSYLDPYGKWLKNLTHFTLSRQLFFASLRKNIGFLRLIVEDIVSWLSEPEFPVRNTAKLRQGEISVTAHRICTFLHGLSVFSLICSYSAGYDLFPIKVSKREDLISVEDVMKMLISLMNETRVSEMVDLKSTEEFKRILAFNIARLLCLKRTNGSSYLLLLLKNIDYQDPSISQVKIKVFDYVSQCKYSNNPLNSTESGLKRRSYSFLHCFISTAVGSANLTSCTNTKQKREMERQSSLRLSINQEPNEVTPIELYAKLVTKLNIKGLKENSRVIEILTRMFQEFDTNLVISHTTRALIVKFSAENYLKLQESFKLSENKLDNSDLILSNCYAQFLLQTATSPIGFYTLQYNKVVPALLLETLQNPMNHWSNSVSSLFISKAITTDDGSSVLASESNKILTKQLTALWDTFEEDHTGSELPVEEAMNRTLNLVTILSLHLKGVKALLVDSLEGSEVTITDEFDVRPHNLYFLIHHFALNFENCPDFSYHYFSLIVLEILTSNIDSSIYLQNKLKYSEILLQLQSDSRVDDSSEVIVDECSLLRQRIIERTYLPGQVRLNIKPTHSAPRPESTLTRSKPRSRGTGELARWLSETRLGLHDANWLKHARKLYRNSCPDDVKGSTILDLLEQVVKVLPENKFFKWQSLGSVELVLEPEEQLAVQLVMRYGTHHRLIQTTQQNVDNLTQLVLSAKATFNLGSSSFEGFDWFVASVYLICSGNLEKSQAFLMLVPTLPTAPLMWMSLAGSSGLAQLGSVFETLVGEEMPALLQVLHTTGLPLWNLSLTWLSQCWWNVLDWSIICHWFTLSILYQLDHMLYFCVALLQVNYDRLLKLAEQGAVYHIVTNPFEKYQLSDIRVVIDRLHKKYHSMLHASLASFNCN